METNNLMSQEDLTRAPDVYDILEAADNVADILTDSQLDQIGKQVVADYKLDKGSMSEWLTMMEKAINLASQETKRKNEPWENASNVKHALILEACIQFSARAFPEIIRDNKVVKSKIFGKDPKGEQAARAKRIEEWMNYDVLERMTDWDGDLDRLLQMISMVGTMFKKTYYCPVERRTKSVVCLPDKIILNQSTQSISEARRITHEIELYDSQIEERKRVDIFLDIELKGTYDPDQPDSDQEHLLLEQMRYLDLDGDGYPESYFVTVHEQSEKVLRITPAYQEDDITWGIKSNGDEFISKISRQECYADFHFIHSVDGTFYSYGFGYLLSHATETINTLLNQIIDAGTLDNLQGGFIGKGARVRGGQVKFKPGKWIKADASGGDLKNSIVPLPTKGPSPVLLQLVQFLLQSYYRMISISDIMSGQVSGSNTTAAEAMQAVEQGMKVMNAIYKRIYRGMKKEFKQLFKLYLAYPDDATYQELLDDPQASMVNDFDLKGLDLVPVADGSMSTQLEEVMRLRSVIELQQFIPEMQRIPLGRRLLQAMRVDNIDEILPATDPNKPTPQQQQFAQELHEKAEALDFQNREIQVKEGDLQLKAVKLQYEIGKLVADTEKSVAQAQREGASIDIEAYLASVRSLEAEAKYIQAIQPEPHNQGASQNDNTGNTQ